MYYQKKGQNQNKTTWCKISSPCVKLLSWGKAAYCRPFKIETKSSWSLYYSFAQYQVTERDKGISHIIKLFIICLWFILFFR